MYYQRSFRFQRDLTIFIHEKVVFFSMFMFDVVFVFITNLMCNIVQRFGYDSFKELVYSVSKKTVLTLFCLFCEEELEKYLWNYSSKLYFKETS